MKNKLVLTGALACALLLAGCSSSGSTATTPTPAPSTPVSTLPVASITPGSLTFAATPAGATAAAQTLTVTNTGAGTLTITAVSLSGTNAAQFAEINTCGSLAAGGACTIAVTFTPTVAAASYTANLTVTDNTGGVTGSTQTLTLSGTGAAPTPTAQATLSTTALTFPATAPGVTSAAMTAQLTNSGNAPLTISSITLAGVNPADFAQTNTCGLTLAAGASCGLSVTFTPAAAATYTATLVLADSAAGSPQTITLQGAGVAPSAITRTLLAFPEADNSVTPLYTLINAAQKTVDMTMYALEDTTFTADLLADCKRGVTVRVILDQNLEKSGNTSAYNQLNAQTNCSAVWANKVFQAAHEKSFVIDGATAAILSLNLQSQYYSTTRDYALIENDLADIAAIEATFAADYAAGVPLSGVSGASDFSYTPGGGDNNDLIWSPTTAQAAMLGLINNATSTIVLENEEMSAANIVSALVSACQRGVKVHIAMVNSSSYTANFSALKAAGCGVNLYANVTGAFYIHAKAVVADYGLTTQSVYMGSINYSNASMNSNRELGLYITDPTAVKLLYTTMSSDYAGGTPY